jgi:tetratricopeptide (TPR) repeat protein
MKKLIHEVHRRSLWQVMGIYLAGAWISLQVVGQMADSLALPEWVEPFAVVLLIIGLPIVLATAFVQEAGSRRAEPEPAVDPESSTTPPAAPAPVAASEVPVGHRVLTWRNAVVGGILAFLLLGTAVGAFMLLRSAGIGTAGSLVAKGLLDERAPIVVADFASPDSLLGRAATEAFRIDISQSPIVQVLEPAELAEGLERMERSARDGLDVEVALELAVREGIPAVVAGEITPVGKGFVLSARVLEPSGGATLASVRETASDTASVLEAIDKLSKRIRERIGESYVSLRADPALEKVTTASLEALQLYTEALDAYMVEGDNERGLTLLEEAVALDPEFAMAWRKMGIELNNNFASQARINEALTRAYEHRDRLPERERLLAMAAYYNTVTGEDEKAIAAYERMLDRDPNDPWATNNASILYGELRDHERAEAYMERSFEIDSSVYTSYTNLANVKYAYGKRDEAWDLLRRAQLRFPDNPAVDLYVAMVHGSERNFATADSILRDLAGRYSSHLGIQRSALGRRAAFAFSQGRIAESERLRSQAADLAVETGDIDDVHLYAFWNAFGQLMVVQDTAAAVEAVQRGLERVPSDDLPFADRRHFWLVSFYALAGDLDQAQSYLSAFETEATEDQKRAEEDALLQARGFMAYASGDPAGAAALYAEADRGSCTICTLSLRALAWDAAGQPDSALVYWKRYLDDTQINRMYWDQNQLGAAIERAAQLSDELGDTEQAALYYDQLVELWAEADPELQPRVQAAQARLEEIVRERG